MMSNDGRATDSVRIISTFLARTMFALPFNCKIISSNHLSISFFVLTLAHTVHVRICDESVEKMLKLSRHCYLGTKEEEESNLSVCRRAGGKDQNVILDSSIRCFRFRRVTASPRFPSCAKKFNLLNCIILRNGKLKKRNLKHLSIYYLSVNYRCSMCENRF